MQSATPSDFTLCATNTTPMKTVKVYKFDSKNFKKSGGLKKTANPVIGISISDSDDSKYDNKYIADRIKKAIPGIVNITSPYFFTHISLDTKDASYKVFETVYVAGSNLLTSPTNLLAALKSN